MTNIEIELIQNLKKLRLADSREKGLVSKLYKHALNLPGVELTPPLRRSLFLLGAKYNCCGLENNKM